MAQQLVTRYNIAYINDAVCQVDNGRVLGIETAARVDQKSGK
jgi:hypothetical protein